MCNWSSCRLNQVVLIYLLSGNELHSGRVTEFWILSICLVCTHTHWLYMHNVGPLLLLKLWYHVFLTLYCIYTLFVNCYTAFMIVYCCITPHCIAMLTPFILHFTLHACWTRKCVSSITIIRKYQHQLSTNYSYNGQFQVRFSAKP